MQKKSRVFLIVASAAILGLGTAVPQASADSTRDGQVTTKDGGKISYRYQGEGAATAKRSGEKQTELLTGQLDSGSAVSFNLPDGARFIEGENGAAAVRGEKLLFVVWAPDGEIDVDGSAVTARTDDGSKTALAAGTLLIDRVETRSVAEGTIWAVFPTVAGRAAPSAAHATAGWGDIKGMGVPDRPGLNQQYVCHPISQAARIKESWNLDSWRPTVGLPATIAAACNP